MGCFLRGEMGGKVLMFIEHLGEVVDGCWCRLGASVYEGISICGIG